MPEPLCEAILAKVGEQIERADHLIGLLSPEQLNWKPQTAGAWTTARVLGHLLDCLAGICAVLAAVHPERLSHFQELRRIPVNRPYAAPEARDAIATYYKHIEEGFRILQDTDLTQRIPTVFVKKGELVLTLLLGNLEHLINHKHQLFIYLKLMGADIASADLYSFREES